jgi:hypothetical protein
MIKIKQNLKAAQDGQKSYADKNKNHREFKVGDHVFLKVKTIRNSLKLGSCTKLATRFCGPFEILLKYWASCIHACITCIYDCT